MTGLSFCTCSVLLIDEVDKFSHKVNENRQFYVVKTHTDVEQQVESYLLLCRYNYAAINVMPQYPPYGGRQGEYREK